MEAGKEAGSEFGNAFHTGRMEQTDPERVLTARITGHGGAPRANPAPRHGGGTEALACITGGCRGAAMIYSPRSRALRSASPRESWTCLATASRAAPHQG
jgi:hypothetical protein